MSADTLARLVGLCPETTNSFFLGDAVERMSIDALACLSPLNLGEAQSICWHPRARPPQSCDFVAPMLDGFMREYPSTMNTALS